MQTVVELPAYLRKAEKLFTKAQMKGVVDFIAAHPESGDEIPGTGGLRKLRFAAKGKGKRGGARVVYFLFNESIPMYLIACFGKNEKSDLTPEQKRVAVAFATATKAKAKQKGMRK